jgi:membrane protease subunit HflK
MSWQDQGGSGDKGGKRRNPWGQPENRPNSPWGNQRPNPENDGAPDLDEIIRKVKESFGGKFPADGNPFKYALLIVTVLTAIWFASGFFLIQPSEHGVVTTFGKYTRTETTSGLKYRLPWPIQNAIIVPVTVERRIQIGFSDGPPTRRSGQDLTDESLMLTGDENIVDIDFVVLWRISNARDYLFSIRDPDTTIKLVAESAMREIIGQTKIQSALTEARGQIQDDTRLLMQSILDEYNSGVLINNVQLQKVDPPGDVVDAFNEVQRARQEKERLRNEAEAYRNDIIPRAKGEGEKLRQQAEGYQQEVVSRAKGDADRFNQIYAAYRNSKTVTAERMYIETVQEILQNAKVIYMGSEKGGNVLPYLPLNNLQRTQTAKPASSLNDAAPAAGQ